jgi:hypothetical protein
MLIGQPAQAEKRARAREVRKPIKRRIEQRKETWQGACERESAEALAVGTPADRQAVIFALCSSGVGRNG